MYHMTHENIFVYNLNARLPNYSETVIRPDYLGNIFLITRGYLEKKLIEKCSQKPKQQLPFKYFVNLWGILLLFWKVSQIQMRVVKEGPVHDWVYVLWGRCCLFSSFLCAYLLMSINHTHCISLTYWCLQQPNAVWQFWRNLSNQSIVVEVFDEEMLLRILYLQLSFKYFVKSFWISAVLSKVLLIYFGEMFQVKVNLRNFLKEKSDDYQQLFYRYSV